MCVENEPNVMQKSMEEIKENIIQCTTADKHLPIQRYLLESIDK